MLHSAVVVWCGCGPRSNDWFLCEPPTSHLIRTTSAPLLCRFPLLNNYCVLFMTSNMAGEESTAMPAHPTRAAPPTEPDSPIAPHQLWGYLSRSPQQHVRTVLIRVAQHVVASLPRHQASEETSYAPQSPSQSGDNHGTPPGAQSRDLHSPIQPQAGA